MSMQAITWVDSLTVGDAGAKAVLFCLANYANHESGSCFPGLARIARSTELTERHVKRKIGFLEEHGFIRVSKARDRRVNAYQLMIPPYFLAMCEGAQAPGPDEPELSQMSPIANTSDDASMTYEDGMSQMSPITDRGHLQPEKGTSAAEIGDISSRSRTQITHRTLSPQSPPPGAERERIETDFQNLLGAYGVDASTAIGDARRIWSALTDAERARALAAVDAYIAARAAAGRTKPVALDNWLRRKAWEDVEEAARVAAKKPSEAKGAGFTAKAGSEEFEAWTVFHRLRGAPGIPAYALKRIGGVECAIVRNQWPPIGRGIDADTRSWLEVTQGTPNYAAWMRRLDEVGGGPVALGSATIAGRMVRVLRVPTEWPPAKGTGPSSAETEEMP
jgi:hypothetical protein